MTELPESARLLLDPNWRPGATPDADGYGARIKRILPRTDIVKTSIEDLQFLVPQTSVADAAHLLLDWGAGCVLVTHGPDPVEAFGSDYELVVPLPSATGLDTVRAPASSGARSPPPRV